MKFITITKKVIYLIAILCSTLIPQEFQWAKSMSGDVKCNAIAIDNKGNILVTGSFSYSATFETTQLTSIGREDIFIAKYDGRGNLLWVRQAGGTGFGEIGSGISSDTLGNIYVTGGFAGNATFGTTQLTGYGNLTDTFIAKYDPDGNLIWVRHSGGSSLDLGRGITTDNTGNSYIIGSFGNNALFGIPLTSRGDFDIFIAKLGPDHYYLWTNQAGGTSIDQGFAITTDNTGNCYVTGSFVGTATFGNTQITNSGSHDIFIAKYDSNGNFLWVKKAGGTIEDRGTGITTDNAGNCYITGYFWDTATFGTTQLTSSGGYDIFIAKYDSNGNFLWAKQAGGKNADQGLGITSDNKGNIYVTGSFSDSATFGVHRIASYGYDDLFVAKYNVNGNLLWVKQAGGIRSDVGSGITTDNKGSIYLTGSFQYGATFGSIVLNGEGGFIAKIAEVTDIKENSKSEIPSEFSLSQNYPNPFNPSTKITVVLPEESKIKLSLYNNLGEEIEVLIEGIKSAGRHEINFEAKGLSSGVYFYSLEYIKGKITKKMTLMR